MTEMNNTVLDDTGAIELYRELVMLMDGEGFTSTRHVAKKFNKTNNHVLRDFDRLSTALKKVNPDLDARMFVESSYVDMQGKVRREVLMNYDGFMLLSMRFSGEAALNWQILFMNAFKWLYKQLVERDENNRLMALFERKNTESIACGSYHGTGLQRRKVEKKTLEQEEAEIKTKIQMSMKLVGGSLS